MKEKTFTSIFDEKYYALITMKSNEIIKIKVKFEDYIGYVQTANRPPGESPAVVGLFVKETDFKENESILLSRDEIMLLNVLFHLSVNSETDTVITTLSEICHNLLGQAMNNNTYNKIRPAITKLTKLYIYDGRKEDLYSRNTDRYFSKLISSFKRYNITENNYRIEYSFGDFGNTIKLRKRYADLVPISYIRSKNIARYCLSLAICRYIYMNAKKKNREYGFHLQTILKQINYFGKNGINLGISYDNILRKEKVSNKTHLLKQFIGNITQVMEELKSKNNIDGFETKKFDKKPSVLNYDKYYILLTLLPKKMK